MFSKLRRSTQQKPRESRPLIDPKKSIFELPNTITLDFAPSPLTASEAFDRRSSFLPASALEDTSDFSRSHFTFISGSLEERPSLVVDAKGLESPIEERTFITKSKYIGRFNQLGMMSGKGLYQFPHGVVYDGNFNNNGEFHGTGCLIYPGGQHVHGIWDNGRLSSSKADFRASDTARFDSTYCQKPDRRFQIELKEDLQPAGAEYLTNAPEPRAIPPGMYDTGYGFYDPQRKVVIDYQRPELFRNLFDIEDDERQLLYNTFAGIKEAEASSSSSSSEEEGEDEQDAVRLSRTKGIDNMILHIVAIPIEEKEKWVMNNCRKPWDENVGYRPDLYESWTTGSRRDELKVERELSKVSLSKTNALIKRFSQFKPKAPKLYSFTSAKIKSQMHTLEDLVELQANKMAQLEESFDRINQHSSTFF